MMRLICAVGLSGALALSACSSSSGNKNGDSGAGGSMAGQDAAADAGPALVTVSGTAAPHPLTAALDPSGHRLQHDQRRGRRSGDRDLRTRARRRSRAGRSTRQRGNCPAATGCAWSFDNVNISAHLARVGRHPRRRAHDRPPVGQDRHRRGRRPTSSTCIKMTRAPITNGRCSRSAWRPRRKLAMFAAAVARRTRPSCPGTLTARGFMIGTIVGKLSSGAMPVAGATRHHDRHAQ